MRQRDEEEGKGGEGWGVCERDKGWGEITKERNEVVLVCPEPS